MNELLYVTSVLVLGLVAISSTVAIFWVILEVYKYIKSKIEISNRKKEKLENSWRD
jgi:hypothetical protein